MVLPSAQSRLGAQLARQPSGVAKRGSDLLLRPAGGAGLLEMGGVVGQDVVDLGRGQPASPSPRM